MKKLKDFLEVYEPKAPDEKKFKDKHVTIKFKDRNEVGGKENGDDVFNASNVKTVARKGNRHGYDVGEDEKVYEEVDIDLMDENELLEFALDMLEKTLTPAEIKKREEIAKAIERENPKMPMAQKMAIATAQAKKVAEEVEDLDETSAKKAMNYLSKSFAPREAAAERSARATRYNPGDREKAGRLLGNKMKGAERARKIIGKSFTVKEEVEDIEESAKVVAHLVKRYGNNIRKSHVMSAANDFGVGYTGLSRMVRKKLGVDRLEEEQIDELSTKSLEKYKNVARADAYDADASDDEPRFRKRAKGLMQANKAIRKNFVNGVDEEVESIDELSKQTLGSYAKKAVNQTFNKGVIGGMAIASRGMDSEEQGNKLVDKAAKRMVGAQKAISKMTKEEVNDVPFKGPYDKPGQRKDEYGNTIATKNIPRHLARKAMKALTKEDIIDRAVSKYVPEELKYTPEERMIKRLEGLSEGHIVMIMSLFESLNDMNQSKMIESAETEDGVNQLLDFAINNRGA